MRRVAILGSTGSIGRNTLDVIASHPDKLTVVGLAANTRTHLLAEQVQRSSPSMVVVWDESRAQEVVQLTGRTDIRTGLDGLCELCTHPDVDVVVIAMSGNQALIPLVRALQAGKRIALASKELLVMAGELLTRLVQEHGTTLVPIDSEHAALFQCLQGLSRSQVARLIVTGSGGPLWPLTPAERQTVTRAQVLAHPKWRMGPKITVDSATLMNKGLEVIEAQWLFALPPERIQVVIHPEAVIHGLVEVIDGTLLAQLSRCDMRLPIQFALSFPERWEHALPHLTLPELSGLRFFEPDLEEFPCLRLALDAAAAGGTACTALNAANDTAVQAYLDDRLPFGDIPRVIAQTLEQCVPVAHPTLEDILEADRVSRATANELVHQWSLR
ncbi:MAG: 1-deoxy-D-xylulose-5-phosphate reductoisomerase [Candidatus Omnitrophica bacterium CG11_big_fil_rev_8_21_14_0_20_63_9]|nr:MAG: 1-deoxy-D-xylulose-5-phosphate reductoisomerase [Candidatus Omnitrophica bacterium CG11_big_fil_rev_8_21_14_0_20_63_9]